MTSFALAVRIADPDGTPPSDMRVRLRRLVDNRRWIAHTSLPLTATSGSWEEGMVCQASTTLQNGVYRYRFYAADDEGVAAAGVPTVWKKGPKINGPPQLWCTDLVGRTHDFVHPNTGTAGETRFKFSVQYTDSEGDPPVRRRIDVQKKRRDGVWRAFCAEPMAMWGGAPRGGKYFTWQRKLPPGEYRFRFAFADPDGPALADETIGGDCTQWQYGPVVSEATSDSDAATGAGTLVSSLAISPTSMGAQVALDLWADASVDASVLNLAGRPVRTLCRGRQCSAGQTSLLWNALSDRGLAVPNGTYLVEVIARSEDGSAARRVAPLRIQQ